MDGVVDIAMFVFAGIIGFCILVCLVTICCLGRVNGTNKKAVKAMMKYEELMKDSNGYHHRNHFFAVDGVQRNWDHWKSVMCHPCGQPLKECLRAAALLVCSWIEIFDIS